MSTAASDKIKKDEIFDQVQDLVRKFFKCPDQIVTHETVAFDVNGWDSLAHAAFMLELEGVFGIGFSISEVLEFENISSIVDAIFSHQIHGSLPHVRGIPQLDNALNPISPEYQTLFFDFNRSQTIESVANNGIWDELEKDGFRAAGDQGMRIDSENNFVDLPCQCNPKDQLLFFVNFGLGQADAAVELGLSILINGKECAVSATDEKNKLTFTFSARDHLGADALDGKNIFRLQFKSRTDAVILEKIALNRITWSDNINFNLGNQSYAGENLWGNLWRTGGVGFLMDLNNQLRGGGTEKETPVKIHAIGDSHASYYFAVYPEFKVHYVGAYSIFHLIKHRIDLADYGVTPGQKVVFCFGEIDCRTIMGSMAGRIAPQDFATYLADEYLKAVNAICEPMDVDAALVLPIPPFAINISNDKFFPVVGSLPERVEYTRMLCSALGELKGKGRITGIIDAYSPYVSGIGVLDRFFAADEAHLRPDRTDPLFAQAMAWFNDG